MKTPKLIKAQARNLRKKQTNPETILWQRLRNRQLGGLKFRRQHALGNFIVDFYCASHRLVIELDGGIHHVQHEYDQARTLQIQSFGYQVLRFTNQQLEDDIESVLATILAACKTT